jgi:type I restriction enzyme S subunit
MTKSAATQNDTPVGAQFIAPEACATTVGNGWRESSLGDFADIQTGPFGSQLHAHDYVSHGIPSIMPTNIGSRLEINVEKIVFITEKDAKRLERYLVKENDIVYSRRGDVEKCAFIRKKQSGWLCGTGCLRVRIISNDLDAKFCAYYLSTDEIKGWVSSNAVGTTMPNLNSSILKKLPLIVPPLPEQKAIAAVLSSLDDKIDLLHRQNQTLEAMAQTLFRQWFIEETREDWEEVPLSNLFEISSGKGLSKEDFLDDGIYQVLGANGIIGRTDNYNFFEKLIYTGRVGTLGNIFIINTEPVWLSDNTLVMRNIKYFYFTYFTLKNASLKDYNAGSTQPLLRQSDVKAIPYLKPSTEKLLAFESFAAINFSKIEANTKQIQTLTQLRDTLLPKLMSGEVRVSFDQQIEEASCQ